MAIHTPEQRVWWREPVEFMEIAWVTVAFVWGLVMFSTMILWHVYGRQNLANEAYRVNPDDFAARVEAQAAKYKVRDEGNTGMPVVHPPPGGDVWLLGRTWQWWPALELEKGQSYRLHLSSAEFQHGFSLQPLNINVQVHPGYEMVLTVRPTETGSFGLICNEFCGIGHHTMTGRVYVIDAKTGG